MTPLKVIAVAAVIETPSVLVTETAVGVPESIIWIATLVVPAATARGVPEMIPAVERLSPAGSVLPETTVHI
jgi:hypothetical protein